MLKLFRKLLRLAFKIMLVPILLIALIFGAAALTTKTASASAPTFKEQIEVGTNIYRANNGLGALSHDDNLARIAQAWADELARNSQYFHNPNLSSQVFSMDGYWAVAENLVAQRPDGNVALESWVGSDGHRANLLGNYNRQGVGVAYGGQYDITYVQVLAFKEVFAPPAPQQPATPQPPTTTAPPTPQPEQPAKPLSPASNTATGDRAESSNSSAGSGNSTGTPSATVSGKDDSNAERATPALLKAYPDHLLTLDKRASQLPLSAVADSDNSTGEVKNDDLVLTLTSIGIAVLVGVCFLLVPSIRNRRSSRQASTRHGAGE